MKESILYKGIQLDDDFISGVTEQWLYEGEHTLQKGIQLDDDIISGVRTDQIIRRTHWWYI